MGPPYPPSPLPPRGSGFPQESMLPPGARCLHGSELPALLLDFFLASRCQGQAFRPQVSGHPPYFPHCFHGTGDRCPQSGVRGFQTFRRPCFQGPGLPLCFHAFRRPCFPEASSMLSGGKAFRRPCFPRASRGPGIFELFFLRSICAFCFCFAASRLSAFRLSGDRGPGTGDRGPGFQGPWLPALLFFLRSIFGLCLLY